MKRQIFRPAFLPIFSLASIWLANVSYASSALGASPPAAVHGMVLFGQGPFYASHIPMFSPPHDWQAILQVELSHPTKDAEALYLATQQDQQTLITLKPEPFVLPDLLSGALVDFVATMYRGSFEQDGQPLLSGVTVHVKKVIETDQLKKSTPTLPTLKYLALGGTLPTYLVHKIAAPASFDQVVQITWLNVPPNASPQALVFDTLADAQANKLKLGEVFTVKATSPAVWTAQPAPNGGEGELAFKVVSDFYCTPGPDFFGDC